jgi:hypothetical protein
VPDAPASPATIAPIDEALTAQSEALHAENMALRAEREAARLAWNERLSGG